jgi:hypothetical protein
VILNERVTCVELAVKNEKSSRTSAEGPSCRPVPMEGEKERERKEKRRNNTAGGFASSGDGGWQASFPPSPALLASCDQLRPFRPPLRLSAPCLGGTTVPGGARSMFRPPEPIGQKAFFLAFSRTLDGYERFLLEFESGTCDWNEHVFLLDGDKCHTTVVPRLEWMGIFVRWRHPQVDDATIHSIFWCPSSPSFPLIPKEALSTKLAPLGMLRRNSPNRRVSPRLSSVDRTVSLPPIDTKVLERT